jgi:hypothetical protein
VRTPLSLRFIVSEFRSRTDLHQPVEAVDEVVRVVRLLESAEPSEDRHADVAKFPAQKAGSCEIHKLPPGAKNHRLLGIAHCGGGIRHYRNDLQSLTVTNHSNFLRPCDRCYVTHHANLLGAEAPKTILKIIIAASRAKSRSNREMIL